MKMCTQCKVRPSTGIMVPMCDPCFEAWDDMIQRSVEANDGEPIEITDAEFAAIFGAHKPGRN